MYFVPRALTNLMLIDEMQSLAPLMDMQVPGWCVGGVWVACGTHSLRECESTHKCQQNGISTGH